jgi:hypothetical protein
LQVPTLQEDTREQLLISAPDQPLAAKIQWRTFVPAGQDGFQGLQFP